MSSGHRQDRHISKEQRLAFLAFKLTLRGFDYYLTIRDRMQTMYIMVFNFVSASLFKTSTGEGEKWVSDHTCFVEEGKKVNWAPWNCMRIIMESVGPGENHGCPYKHHDPDVLRAALVKSGLEAGSEDLNNVSKFPT